MIQVARQLTFIQQSTAVQIPNDLRARYRSMSRDVLALADHASFVANKSSFMLQATLGLINIEQNNIIKIFSVAAAVFLPPTLIASIYGMNFHFMPELDKPYGYWVALGFIVVSAALPYVYFRRRGWL